MFYFFILNDSNEYKAVYLTNLKVFFIVLGND